MKHYVIIGAGIIGLSIANEIVRRENNYKITIIEKENSIGLHASGRNSGVIHSGIYYKESTLKSKISYRSRILFNDFLKNNNIRFNGCGKIITAATSCDQKQLDILYSRSKNIDLDSEFLTEKRLHKIEPYAKYSHGAIYIKNTKVISPMDVLNCLYENLSNNKNISFEFNSNFDSDHLGELTLLTNNSTRNLKYDLLINASGSYADKTARKLGLEHNFELIPFKGLYWKVTENKNFYVNGNIYPVPNPDYPFLGIHFTKDPYGNLYIGPTSTPAFGRENYSLLPNLRSSESWKLFYTLSKLFKENKFNFRQLAYQEFRKYFQYYFYKDANKLVKNFKLENMEKTKKIGIRPQLIDKNTFELVDDFKIIRHNSIVHILNAISPAFTCSFGLAEYIYKNYFK